MRSNLRPCFGLYREGFSAQHAREQLFTQLIHQAVIRAHALLHDLGCDTDHVRVTNLAALDHSHDGHTRSQFARLRRHAQHADIRRFESVEDHPRRSLHRPRSKVFQKQARIGGAPLVQSGGDAGGHGPAGFIGNQGHVFTGAHAQTCFHGVARAGHQFLLWGTKFHLVNST